jgi:hypothetical protein
VYCSPYTRARPPASGHQAGVTAPSYASNITHVNGYSITQIPSNIPGVS